MAPPPHPSRMGRTILLIALPQRTTDRSKISYFDRFQFPLPQDWKAIILARKVGIGPVGV